MADMAGDVDWDESSNQSTSELVGQRITVKQVGPGWWSLYWDDPSARRGLPLRDFLPPFLAAIHLFLFFFPSSWADVPFPYLTFYPLQDHSFLFVIYLPVSIVGMKVKNYFEYQAAV